MIGWKFPSNNHGQETGLNDAGIETFKGKPLESLAREINQNSCDAAIADSGKPVEIHFDLSRHPIDRFPGKDDFIGILKACKLYWQDNDKTTSFFQKALSVMHEQEIAVLKISDYNTTGLMGSEAQHGTDWHNLIKSVGASDKGSTSGGSFGIGKHAPFACSHIRTVFYGTKDQSGKTAFQGVSKLVTHTNSKNETTQGTGYYGYTQMNGPIADFSLIDNFYTRDRAGTDVFVMGFIEPRGWDVKIIKSVLENFLVSIMEEKLVVYVGQTAINRSTLPALLDKYIKNDPDYLSAMYYKSLTSSEAHHFVEEDFAGQGKIELHVLPEKDAPKRVAMVRATGMKVFDKGHFHTPTKFAGVFQAKGNDINAFLRSLEPPSHKDWEYERADDPEQARDILKKLYTWIHDQVRSISIDDDRVELDVEGMSQYLPDDFDETPLPGSGSEPEGEKGAPKEIEFQSRVVDKTVSEKSPSAVSGGDAEADGATEGQGNAENDDGGGKPPIEAGGGAGDGDSSSSALSAIKRPGTSRKPINLKNLRIFCSNPDSGEYRISFESEFDGQGYISVKIVGEVGEDIAPIKQAQINDSEQQLALPEEGQIGPVDLKRGQKSTLQVILSEPLRCALEVSAHAN